MGPGENTFILYKTMTTETFSIREQAGESDIFDINKIYQNTEQFST